MDLNPAVIEIVEQLTGILERSRCSEFSYQGLVLKFHPPEAPDADVEKVNLAAILAKLPAIGPVPGDKPVMNRQAQYASLFGGNPPSFAAETTVKVP